MTQNENPLTFSQFTFERFARALHCGNYDLAHEAQVVYAWLASNPGFSPATFGGYAVSTLDSENESFSVETSDRYRLTITATTDLATEIAR